MSDRHTGDRWAEEFLLAYRAHRIDDQMAFYARRAAENEKARREALWISAACLVLSALFGALATADERRRQLWAVIAAGFGALAAAVGAYEAAFGFERLSRQYEDTRGALHIADVRGPHAAGEPLELDSLLGFVQNVEGILRSEVDNWSQLTSQTAQRADDAPEEQRRYPAGDPRAQP